MKLATASIEGSAQILAIDGDAAFPLGDVEGVPSDMISLIDQWETAGPAVRAALESGRSPLKLREVRLLAPVLRPGKILCIGLNYLDHIEEAGIDRPDQQTWFCKVGTAVNGPNEPIPLPVVSDKLDYEAELVVVVGRRGKHISREDAGQHVFGYCVGNDVSVRDWQLRTSQFIIGKSFDGHAPFGPWITTRDEIRDPHALGIRCLVNGEKRQESNTSYLLFNIWDMIHHLSQAMTLEPGDLIFTGTPGGVGWTMNPRQLLKPRDVVRCEIDQLGAIEGIVTPER